MASESCGNRESHAPHSWAPNASKMVRGCPGVPTGAEERLAEVLEPLMNGHAAARGAYDATCGACVLVRGEATQLAEAILAADYLPPEDVQRREREAKAEALREYRDALAGNESAEHWVGRDAFLHDLDDWIAEIRAEGIAGGGGQG